MTKRLVSLGLGLTLCLGTVYAQPAPPTPAPPDDGGTKTDEKAGNNESLQNGNEAERPWAKGVPIGDQKIALSLFHEGNVALNDGIFVKAVEKYEAALTHWKHPAIHYNLALALLNLDKPIEVLNNLEKAIAYGPAPLEKEKFDHAKEYLLLIQKELADIEVACDKKGAKVSVDGKEVFTVGKPDPVTGQLITKYSAKVRIGKHQFVAEKEGYQARIKAPFIGSGEHFRIELKLYTAEDLTRYHRKFQRTWIPYAVLGGAVVVAGVGALLQFSAKSSYDTFDKRVASCNLMNAGCPITSDLSSIKTSGDHKKTYSDIAFGVAAGAAVTGIILAVVNRRQAYTIKPEELSGESLTFAPIIAPGMAGAGAVGHF